MKENSFISIRNGAVASIIAGIILLVIPTLRGYVASFLSWLWSGLVWCWEAIFLSYALPGLAWLVIFIFAFIGIVKTYLAIRGKEKAPEYNAYVEAFIYDLKWRWDWIGNRITNLWCYCPTCDATLVYNDSSCRDRYNRINKTDFICENCGNKIVATITGGNKSYAISAVEREIDRRVRTGEYKNH